MIPSAQLSTDIAVSEIIETTKTYKLYEDKIQGYTDNLSALQQAIYKMLNTEKYEYPIYSLSYGVELESLIGKEPAYIKAEMKRRIQECLIRDERITSVDNFTFTTSGDSMLCTFEVVSIYGAIIVSREVGT